MIQRDIQRLSFFDALAVALIAGLILNTACSKREAPPKAEPAPKAAPVSIETPDASAPAPAAANPAPAAPPPPDAPPPVGEGSGDPNSPEGKQLADVQYAFFAYCREHTTPPRDLSDLVAAHYLRALPVPPAGKKFAIDSKNMKVVLVNQ
jgi:hypothetical protein